MIYLLQSLQRGPSKQLGHIFNLCVSLQHQQVVLRDHKVDIYHIFAHLLCHLPALVLDPDGDLVLLLAREHSTLIIVEPYEHIVIESQMESAYVTDLLRAMTLISLDCLRDKIGKLHY